MRVRGWFNADDRAILGFAVPAFAALVSEPLMLLADTAIVGHLGTAPLAGSADPPVQRLDGRGVGQLEHQPA